MLFHMPRNVFGHLKHGHLLFASKNSFERIVGVDQRFLLCVLKLVFLDVIPKLFGHFSPRKRLAYHQAERVSSELQLVYGRFWLLA
jgi:hypothetical protein